MTPADYRARVRAYKAAFEGGPAEAKKWQVRLVARLGLARLARYVLSDPFWLGVVVADLERGCFANSTTYTISVDDPHGRHSAMLEGRRQVYLEIRHYLALTPLEEARIVETLQSDKEDVQRYAS